MNLVDFLARLDFEYEICTANDPDEEAHRLRLVEKGELAEEDVKKPLLRLIDCQGVNLAGIEEERFTLDAGLIERLVERLDIYVNDYGISDFEASIEERGVKADGMDLAALVEKAQELGIQHGVDYEMADAVLHPETIELDPWYVCQFCGEVIEEGEAQLWGHIQMAHPEAFKDLQDLDTPSMMEECYQQLGASFERKIPLVTPAFVYEMMSDLEKANLKTDNGDRQSRYFPVAMGRWEKAGKRVEMCLIEEAAGVPESEQGYAFHIINDVDDSNCLLIQTESLDTSEALKMMEEILEKLSNGWM